VRDPDAANHRYAGRMTTLLLALLTAHAACPDRTDGEKAATTKALATMAASPPADLAGALAKVRKLHTDDNLCTLADRYHAAVLLRRGEVADMEAAFALASIAYAGGLEEAGYVAAQARDAALVTSGRPQFYGVMRGQKGNHTCLFPVDPAATDEERGKLGQKPLAQVYAEVVELAHLPVPPTLAGLTGAGAICDLPTPPGVCAPEDTPDEASAEPVLHDEAEATERAGAEERKGDAEELEHGAPDAAE